MNLLGNAIRYSPEQKPIILSLTQDERQLIVEVEDEGIGIEPEDMPRIFDSFFRGENTGSISGTGLGLSIVKTCIELHDGTIECESQPGIGTCFTLCFPIQS
ncbi:MAG: sensor histidine kinase [Aggregatilineales bacterium]